MMLDGVWNSWLIVASSRLAVSRICQVGIYLHWPSSVPGVFTCSRGEWWCSGGQSELSGDIYLGWPSSVPGVVTWWSGGVVAVSRSCRMASTCVRSAAVSSTRSESASATVSGTPRSSCLTARGRACLERLVPAASQLVDDRVWNASFQLPHSSWTTVSGTPRSSCLTAR